MFLLIDFRIQAHRLVLAASCDYFDAMFSGSFRESTEKEVRLEDVQGGILEALVQFCYSGHVEFCSGNVREILMASHLMQLSPIVAGCSDYLGRNLQASNCLGVLKFAARYDLEPLLNLCESYASEHFLEVRSLFCRCECWIKVIQFQVCDYEEFLELDAEEVAQLLSRDDLDVANEEDVFYGIMKWIDHDSESRKKFLAKLLECVKLALISPDFVMEEIEPVCDDECKELLYQAFRSHSMTCERSLSEIKKKNSKMPNMEQSEAKETMLAIGGCYSVSERGSQGSF